MADRFPLIVNAASKKIEELVAGDNLDLTGNGIIISGDIGDEGQFLRSDGAVVGWAYPGDVFLSGVQTVQDKIFSNCSISGTTNTLTNIPNESLNNSSIVINGTSISLGGSVTTPDTNTTYSISAIDGTTNIRKTIRLTSGGSGISTDQDITLVAGTNVTLDRNGDDITISSSYIDTNTVTTLRSATGGNATSGDIAIAAGPSGNTTVSQSQDGLTITIDSTDSDTITRLRAGTGENLLAGDFTLLAGDEVSLSQTGRDITISSVDTITRLKGGTTGTFTSGDITFVGGLQGNTTVTQTGSTITIDSTDTNTVTRLRGNTGGTYVTGDVTITGSGDTTVEQSGSTITISTNDQDTTYTASTTGGLFLDGTEFSLKNADSLTDQTLPKWNDSNTQFVNSLIVDDGSTVTIGGDLVVSGTTTTINTQDLIVADNTIELRKGNSLTGSNGGIQLNRTTNSTGVVQTFSTLQWYESGAYWRTWDGSTPHRLVTEDEEQTLTNKTLDNPIFTFPTLGIATATSINGLAITSTVSATLGVTNSKTINFTNSVDFNTNVSNDKITVELRNGGNVAYSSDTLAFFSSTTSNQLRGLISDSTGSSKAVFSENPVFTTSVKTTSAIFSVFDDTVATINAFGSASTVTIAKPNDGTTTIRNSLAVNANVTLGNDVGDNVTVNGTTTFLNADITIRGEGNTAAIKVGRGGNDIATNTRVGYNALASNTDGEQNTAFGYEAGYILNVGSNNTAFGYLALREAGAGAENTVVGSDAGNSITSGSRNTLFGRAAGQSLTDQDTNVFIGYAVGAANTGSGNVFIGPASTGDTTSSTYAGPNPSGDNQLVIASGTGQWLRGDATFNVTMPNNLEVQKNVTIGGDLTVNGTTTTINTRNLSVDDKAIELGAVQGYTFGANASIGSNVLSGISDTDIAALVVGMEITTFSQGVLLPNNCIITSIGTNSVILNGNISGQGGTNLTFNAGGSSETTANNGGIILKSSTGNDKTILWTNDGLFDYWDVSENVNLASGKVFSINESIVLSATTLGDNVVNSSLTSVGTLNGLSASGNINLKGRITEKVVNNFNTSIAPTANELEVSAANGNTIVGQLAASAINTWNFTNLGLTDGSSITLTLIVSGNATAIYGDACKVEGTSITGGVRWSGGSPPTNTSNTDILTFIVVRDTSGVTRVYGQGNTGFS